MLFIVCKLHLNLQSKPQRDKGYMLDYNKATLKLVSKEATEHSTLERRKKNDVHVESLRWCLI